MPEVDAEMLVEAPVLGRERRLDQMVGHILERDGIVVLDAAIADLVAVAVEECDRELGFLQPVLVRGFAKGGDGQHQHQHQAAGAECCGFRERFHHQPAPPAGDMEPVHEGGEALIALAGPAPEMEDGAVDAGVDVQQTAADLRLPLLLLGIGIELAQHRLMLEKPAADGLGRQASPLGNF